MAHTKNSIQRRKRELPPLEIMPLEEFAGPSDVVAIGSCHCSLGRGYISDSSCFSRPVMTKATAEALFTKTLNKIREPFRVAARSKRRK